jgi:YD repeat-containing protein
VTFDLIIIAVAVLAIGGWLYWEWRRSSLHDPQFRDTLTMPSNVAAESLIEDAQKLGGSMRWQEAVDALVAENQQLRDSLELMYDDFDRAQRIDDTGGDSAVVGALLSWDERLHRAARAAADGTPSEATE